MNGKKIAKILTPLSGVMTFMLVMGIMTMPVLAEETKIEDVAYDGNSEAVDYATYINSTSEKSGFKLTLSKVVASKNNINITVRIQFPKEIDEKNLKNDLYSLTIKKADCQCDLNGIKKINDKELELNFKAMSFKGFPESADLRFDVILPEYNLNGWVNATVDLTKNIDKVITKDILINNDKTKTIYNKFESDVLGTKVYCKESEDDTDYEEAYSHDNSILLLKCDNKLYELNEEYYDCSQDEISSVFICKDINYDDINKAESVSLIPVECNIKNKEIDDIYENQLYEETENDQYENISYNKEIKFADGKNGEISKIEKENDKVKLYCSSDSEKKSLLMAIRINGYCCGVKDYYYGKEVTKVIYKNPDDPNGYIVEFGNVDKDAELNVNDYNILLEYDNKFELGEEVKIK